MTLGEREADSAGNMDVDSGSETGSELVSEAPPLLPGDCVGRVFAYLTVQDLGMAAQACWQWSEVAEREFIWKDITLRRWIFATDKGDESWRTYHKRIHTRGSRWERGRPADFKMIPLRGHTAPITSAILDNDMVISGSLDKTVKIWGRQGKEFTVTRSLEAPDEVQGVVAAEDPVNVFANSVKSIASWDIESGAAVAQYSLSDASPIRSFSVDEDNDVVVGGSEAGAILVWDCRNSKPPQLQLAGHGHGSPVFATHCAWDKRQQIVAASTSGVVIWDTRQTGQPLVSVDVNHCSCLEWDPTSDTAVWGTQGGELSCLNTRSGTAHSALGAPLYGMGQGMGGVTCVSINGSHAAAGFGDGTVKFITKAQSHSPTPWRDAEAKHKGRVNSIRVDSHKVVSGGADNCSLLFDVATGQQLYALLGGSMQVRANNPPLPERPWVSGIRFDSKQVLATVNSMMRVYHFDLSPTP